jgi:AcrR family transcriptional regulator
VRERILDAADRIIRERGFGAATTKEIAREARCAEGSIYVHFTDKVDLFTSALLERNDEFAELGRLPERAGERTVQANLEDEAVALIEFLSLKLPYMLSVLGDRCFLERYGDRMRAERRGPFAMADALQRYFRLEQKLGRVGANVDVAAAASLFIGACRDHVIAGRMLGESPEEPRGFARSMVRTLMKGLTPRATAAQNR